MISATSTAIAFSVFYWMPVEYNRYLYQEDHLVENVTALLLVISVVFGLLFSLTSNIYWEIQVIISVVGLLGFLDEISFGKGIFRFDSPRVGGWTQLKCCSVNHKKAENE